MSIDGQYLDGNTPAMPYLSLEPNPKVPEENPTTVTMFPDLRYLIMLFKTIHPVSWDTESYD